MSFILRLETQVQDIVYILSWRPELV